MVVHDSAEQERLFKEIDEAIKTALKTYVDNMEEIYGYGCDDGTYKQEFLKKCGEVIN